MKINNFFAKINFFKLFHLTFFCFLFALTLISFTEPVLNKIFTGLNFFALDKFLKRDTFFNVEKNFIFIFKNVFLVFMSFKFLILNLNTIDKSKNSFNAKIAFFIANFLISISFLIINLFYLPSNTIALFYLSLSSLAFVIYCFVLVFFEIKINSKLSPIDKKHLKKKLISYFFDLIGFLILSGIIFFIWKSATDKKNVFDYTKNNFLNFISFLLISKTKINAIYFFLIFCFLLLIYILSKYRFFYGISQFFSRQRKSIFQVESKNFLLASFTLVLSTFFWIITTAFVKFRKQSQIYFFEDYRYFYFLIVPLLILFVYLFLEIFNRKTNKKNLIFKIVKFSFVFLLFTLLVFIEINSNGIKTNIWNLAAVVFVFIFMVFFEFFYIKKNRALENNFISILNLFVFLKLLLTGLNYFLLGNYSFSTLEVIDSNFSIQILLSICVICAAVAFLFLIIANYLKYYFKTISFEKRRK